MLRYVIVTNVLKKTVLKLSWNVEIQYIIFTCFSFYSFYTRIVRILNHILRPLED